jgi:hypothetical protein
MNTIAMNIAAVLSLTVVLSPAERAWEGVGFRRNVTIIILLVLVFGFSKKTGQRMFPGPFFIPARY